MAEPASIWQAMLITGNAPKALVEQMRATEPGKLAKWLAEYAYRAHGVDGGYEKQVKETLYAAQALLEDQAFLEVMARHFP